MRFYYRNCYLIGSPELLSMMKKQSKLLRKSTVEEEDAALASFVLQFLYSIIFFLGKF